MIIIGTCLIYERSIMQVNRVDNNVSFGIKIPNKNNWNKNALAALENSKLVKQIDKKYPDAVASYDKFFDWEDETYTVVSQLKLNKDKSFRWTLSSHSESFPDNQFVKFIKSADLKEVEDKSVKTLEPVATIEVTVVKPSLKDRIKNIFKFQ